ncbi:ATPase [Sinorhizobium fredii CCBAU 83666]|nr:ATPase [Sinorhizobium fredii CCBAU 83666]
MTADSKDEFLSDLVMKKITIHDYRGLNDPVVISLKRDANFLIGRNGTGKTTLINLIYQLLSGRHSSLFEAEFTKAEIVFSHPDKRFSPTLFVEKDFDEDGDPRSLIYRFRDFKSKGDSFRYSFYSKYYRSTSEPASLNLRKLRTELQKRFQVTWLALNRNVGVIPLAAPDGSKTKISEIDSKLIDSIQRLSTYVTKLDGDFSDELENFQKQLLLSFLVEEKQDIIVRRVNHLDLEEEESQITSMLRELKLSAEEYVPKVERHISMAKMLASHANMERSFSGIIKLYDIWKLHAWVDKWRILQDQRAEIYLYKDKFLQKLNEMLYRKVAFFDGGNVLRIVGFPKDSPAISPDNLIYDEKNPGNIDIKDLSSGEKQLIIFLAETLLRERRPYVYIADEPELSLHIEWQEKLVPVILEISPQAQIFFATHSPDIVNQYGDNVFSMEELAY